MFFQEVMLGHSHAFHVALHARFLQLAEANRIQQTHYLEGRFENTYATPTDIPDITPVLASVKKHAGRCLGVPAETLKAGFWFNAMDPGQRTLPHHHDENDELLSAVYYIRVPENSGDLILHLAGDHIIIRPQEGKLVLFSPELLHEVTPNLSAEMRLSVALNIGPANS